MSTELQNRIERLRGLQPNELYQAFHRIQFEVLNPQWQVHLESLIGSSREVKELFGPRTPAPSERFSADTLEAIRQRHGNGILLLHHVLPYLENPLEAISLARDVGYTRMIIHDCPSDGTSGYECYPKMEFVAERDGQKRSIENDVVKLIIAKCEQFGWSLASDTRLDIVYSSESQKMALVEMELGLDLIQQAFAKIPSQFEILKDQLENWYSHPKSRVTAKGYSRWLVLGLTS